MNISLTRPLIIFDLETTGVNTSYDKIVELYMIRIQPDGTKDTRHQRFNPERPIPKEVSAIHGIYDEDVKDAPTFREKAHELNQFLKQCDFAGFNSNKFDFPMLVEEFYRAGVDFEVENRKFIDAQRIFHVLEPRNLAAAYRFYCDKTLDNAHSAEADAEATWEIIQSQVSRYTQLENTVDFLHRFSGQSNLADLAGRIVYNDKGEAVFNFGKHKGKTAAEVFRTEPSYYDWMMNGDFPMQTKKVLTRLRLEQLKNK